MDRRARDDAEREAGRLCVVSQFLPKAIKQAVHRNVGDFRLNGTNFDLIDVEQRIQHARHGAQCVIDAPDQLLSLFVNDFLRQQALEEGEGLQRLSEIVARRGEKARLCNARQFSLTLGGGERIRRAPPFGYVFIGDDDAFGFLVAGAVGHDPADEPGGALTLDFTLERRLSSENRLGLVEESVVGRERLEVRKRAPHVPRNYVEKRFCRRREEADVEASIEKDRRDLGAVKHVLQIVRGRALALERFLQLAVEGGQLLIERLKLFL